MMLLFIASAILFITDAKITEIPLPRDINDCFHHSKAKYGVTTEIGEVVFARCVHRILWSPRPKSEAEMKLGDDAKVWLTHLLEMNRMYEPERDAKGHDRTGSQNDSVQFSRFGTLHHRNHRQKRQGRQPRVRKEYRLLSDRERALFHRAVNMLKQDRTVSPNKFDALGRLHYLSVSRGHFGPNFFPWHRLFLVVFENALREKIPSVTIPYWDSTLDGQLLDPRSSVIWTPEFMGTGNGFVDDGPFANWNTPMGPLVRYFGASGTMLNWTYVKNSLRKQHLEEITSPYAKPDDNLEEHHNQVHLWVGGHMAPPALAAFDPVFYLLHSFTDLLWEIFRGLQKRRNVDPTMDFPRNRTELPPGQAYNDPSGFGTLLNRHALSNVFIDNIYKYDRPPYCSAARPSCGSDKIHCDISGPEPKCVSASIFDIRQLLTPSGIPMHGSSGIREIRSAHVRKSVVDKIVNNVERASDIKCQTNSVDEHYVNNFNIDGVRDENNWMYFPIKIIFSNRSRHDSANPQVYSHCKNKNKMATESSRIFIESNGISYNGLFKEIVHVKHGMGVTQEIAYIAARKPTTTEPSDVVLSGYDTCGRMCQPYCFDVAKGTYRKCPGAIRLTNEKPLQFHADVISASSATWHEDVNGYLTERGDSTFLTMLCSPSESFWPW